MSLQDRIDVLFICTGNTCRSPMAEYLLRDLAGSSRLVIASAGLATFEGGSANETLAEVLRERNGLDLSSHQTRCYTPDLGDRASLIVVMTPEHRDLILTGQHELSPKTFVLTDFSGDTESVSSGIADPIGRNKEVYRETADSMEPYLRNLLAYIQSTTPEEGV